jgi:hypothetical protein
VNLIYLLYSYRPCDPGKSGKDMTRVVSAALSRQVDAEIGGHLVLKFLNYLFKEPHQEHGMIC